MELTIECQTRPAGSKPNALRRSGLTPAVIYGHNGTESLELAVNTKTAEMLIRSAAVNSSLIDVTIPDLSWNGKALLREVQAHPWKKSLYHLSFFAVGSHASLEVDIPLRLVGEPKGVRLSGGTLDQVLTSLHVRCAPDNIPDTIDIDVSGLDVGDGLHVSELTLPDGVVATGESERIVASVLAGRGGGEGASESD
ncbi:50S ribosomal protein L25/general stress protein Ctc [Pantanalinema sp. GBBB05]|uniref:50S ribosomal protein L25/general stress protein Ctc n=1 Tax=Pantanalinema sp. GBBB05 TaxID=2604139 RepID=UPI001D644041|nr:50S ribosomal protein L25/general stress protein Ctc [Pantanalinema sp. GBBB05]